MDSSEPVVFRYKRLPWVCLWIIVICAFNVWIIALSIKNGTWESDRAAVCGLAACFALIGAFVLVSSSDVVIDDNGVSRRLFKVVWKHLYWDNILVITALPVSEGNGKTVRAFNIFPRVKPRFRLLPSGKTFFTEGAGDVASIVSILNFHAQKNGIRLEAGETVGSTLKPVPRL